MTRVVWLAVSWARGHLMRAQIMRRLLAQRGISVDVVTTSREGVEFLDAFGVPATQLGSAPRVRYDAGQNIRGLSTRAGILRYLAFPGGCLADLRALERLARGAALVVNDSFHPALLAAPLVGSPLAGRIVNVYGQHLRRAVEEMCFGFFGEAFACALGRTLARVEHGLATGISPDGALRLPAILEAPSRSAGVVREMLGAAHRPLAVVYLNPHFRSRGLADVLDRTLRGCGFAVHAVGEGFAGRPGWLARDPRLADAVAAADLFVSAPGLGAIAQARTFGTPLLALVTDQPEQRRNVELLPAGSEAVLLEAPVLEDRLRDCALRLTQGAPTPRPDPRRCVRRVHARWAGTFTRLALS